MLARHLGKDLGYISSPDSQREKVCGWLCGRATGYKERLWLWIQGKQTLKSILAVVFTSPGQPHWQGSRRGEIMSQLYSYCPDTSCLRRQRTAGRLGKKHYLPWGEDDLPVSLLACSHGFSSPSDPLSKLRSYWGSNPVRLASIPLLTFRRY